MRKQSSAIRTAYNMLKELEKEKAENPHSQIYHRLRQLFSDLLTGKAREKLKKQWRELRQGTLIAIGSKHKTA